MEHGFLVLNRFSTFQIFCLTIKCALIQIVGNYIGNLFFDSNLRLGKINVIMGIDQKIHDHWPDCSFAKMIHSWGRSFWQKDNLVTFILFELCLLWYLAQSQIWCTTLYISIFHKTEVLTVILRCWTGLNHNWFKSYDTKRKWGDKQSALSIAFSFRL